MKMKGFSFEPTHVLYRSSRYSVINVQQYPSLPPLGSPSQVSTPTPNQIIASSKSVYPCRISACIQWPENGSW